IFTRQIFRKTGYYSLLLVNAYNPLRWPLQKYFRRIEMLLSQKRKLQEIIPYEMYDLQNFVTPYFYADVNSRDLSHAKGVIRKFYKYTAFELLQKKLESLSPLQLRYKKAHLKRLLNQKV